VPPGGAQFLFQIARDPQAEGLAMGILDSLENNPALRSALGQLGAAVLPAVLSEVFGTNNQGGLSAIVARLQQAGFGDQVKSWLGDGQNLPISADQLRRVLGSDTVRQLAARYNIPVDQLSQTGPGAAEGRGSRQPRRQAAPYRVKRAHHSSPDGIVGESISLAIVLK
jgi:uncharacterized protein YidB (DUF937 family)